MFAYALAGTTGIAQNVYAADEEETLTVWCWDPTFNVYAMKQAEAAYQKDHPNFKLDIQEKVYSDIEQSLITAAEAGTYDTLPDIFLMQDYSFHKNVTNYPEIFTELTDSGIDFSQFSAGKLADSTVDEKNYGVPFDNGATIMAIRSDMVEKAGLKVEDFMDTTWSEFIELAKKVVEANDVPMLTSSGGSEIVIEMLQSAGASPIVDGEVKLVDNEALKAAIEVYKQLIDEGIMVDYTDWDQYIASMNKGTAAGVIQGCWIMSSIQAAEDQSGKWAIVNMPALDDIEGATNYANCGGAIASYLPAAESDVYNETSDFYGGQAVYKDIVEFAGQVPGIDYGAYYSDIRSALTDAVTNVVQNDADIDEEIQNAQDTVEFNISE
jgi:lactose/L-arabinose transport system substrate-binding protein